jgi:hypothetical protein
MSNDKNSGIDKSNNDNKATSKTTTKARFLVFCLVKMLRKMTIAVIDQKVCESTSFRNKIHQKKGDGIIEGKYIEKNEGSTKLFTWVLNLDIQLNANEYFQKKKAIKK